jgi:chorismate dehydratase
MRLGVVPFINVKPFIAAYEYGGLQSPIMRYGSPRELAVMMREGDVDAAFIPVYDYIRERENYLLVPGFGVACRGEVASVILFHRVPFEEISTIHADKRSSTSVAMLEILLRKHFNHPAQLVDSDVFSLERPEAVLVIGDRALLPMPGYQAIDLGKAWMALTGHAMVFGVWVAREEETRMAVLQLLARGLEWGSSHMDVIVEKESARTGIAPEIIEDYLSNRIVYQLGPGEMAGLRQFEEYTRHAADKP